MTHNFNSLVKFGLGLSAAIRHRAAILRLPLGTTWLGLNLQAN